MVTSSESAQEYLLGLVQAQETERMAIRMFVDRPGTPQAETCIAYCKPGEQQEDDTIVELNGFNAYFESRSLPF